MKNLITLLIFSSIALLLAFRYPAKKEIEWMDWNEAYEEARKSDKILLIDAYTDWCGWCKRMDKDTYSKPDIINYVNKHFIPVKFNPEIKNKVYKVNGEEMTGPELLYALSGGQRVGYPSTFFLSIEKNEVQKESGYKGPEQFKTILEQKLAWGQEK